MKITPNKRTVDHEYYFTKVFTCPTCGGHLASYDFGRAWTEDGLSEEKKKDCQHCGQEIDWTDVRSPHQPLQV